MEKTRHDRVGREKYMSGSLAAVKALVGNQLIILQESLMRPMGKRGVESCGEPCPCLGVPQSMFVQGVLGPKGKTETMSLVTNRVTPIDCLKFLQRIGVVEEARKEKTRENRNDKIMVDSELASESTLLHAYQLGLLKMPLVSKKLTAVEVDIQFNKSRDGDGGSTGLKYEEFVKFLSLVGNIFFNVRPISVQKSKPSTPDEVSVHSSACTYW